jgi:hypothetical protein
MLDFNTAETQRTREVIPADTVAVSPNSQGSDCRRRG